MRTIVAFSIAALGCAALATAARGDPSGFKSETTALRLSVLGTLVPIAAGASILVFDGPTRESYVAPDGRTISYEREPSRAIPRALIGAGLVIGPSLGHFYAGRWGGLPFRILVIGTTLGGVVLAVAALQGGAEELTEGGAIAALTILAMGSGIVLLSDIHDIGTVTQRVRERNRAVDRVGLSLAPVYRPDTRAAGLALRVVF